ncbi:MAG: DNA-protecting protein DprA [Nitrosopumilus sp.]|nr:DNA-protecting protein DprA [Nitrosopumilus sp.]MDA7942516.1 DNA-protecting protein DprA [Nitrosopumilus sp.]
MLEYDRTPRIRRATAGELLGRPLDGAEVRNAPRIIYCAGPLGIPLPSPRVSVIGSRNAPGDGLQEAGRIAGALAGGGAVVVSGLARGIDTAAHRAAIERGGRTLGVLGTPLGVSYPPENAPLQRRMMEEQMVISQYREGSAVQRRNFAIRNHLMALVSDATVIVRASDGSGSLYQARETLRLGRPLFICAAVMDEPGLRWPAEMLGRGARVLGPHGDVLDGLRARA